MKRLITIAIIAIIALCAIAPALAEVKQEKAWLWKSRWLLLKCGKSLQSLLTETFMHSMKITLMANIGVLVTWC